MDSLEKSYTIIEQIDKIEQHFLNGNIKLLNYELVPLFESIENSMEISNLNNYSASYRKACELLNEKFKELKELIQSFESEELYIDFLREEPTDQEIASLFEGCWHKVFKINQISYNFLEDCKKRLCSHKKPKKRVLKTEDVKSNEEFRLEIPKMKFTEKMMSFFHRIKGKLPCQYKEIFNIGNNQLKLYEEFIYLLHLIQMDKIKYQKETNFLYLEE
jgi:chromatin segregation and condensation protein Rec8/ScpA/Scc1 (kleisin family)